jgi:hypothetical protein
MENYEFTDEELDTLDTIIDEEPQEEVFSQDELDSIEEAVIDSTKSDNVPASQPRTNSSNPQSSYLNPNYTPPKMVPVTKWGFLDRSNVFSPGTYREGSPIVLGKKVLSFQETGLYYKGQCKVAVFRPSNSEEFESFFLKMYNSLKSHYPELVENDQYLLLGSTRHDNKDLLGIYPIERLNQRGSKFRHHHFEISDDNPDLFKSTLRRTLVGYLNRFHSSDQPSIFIQDRMVEMCKPEMDSLGLNISNVYDLRKI